MESLQVMHRNLFFTLAFLLIPDWPKTLQTGLRDVRQYFANMEQEPEYRETYRMLTPEEMEGKPTFQLMDELNL